MSESTSASPTKTTLADRLRDGLVELVNIPSGSGKEKRLADFIEQALRRHPGFEVHRIGDNLVARPEKTRGLPLVLLTGHLDTVPAQDNLPARVDGDRVFGLGSSDLKSGLSVYLKLIESLDLRVAPYDPVFVFYTCEEVAYHQSGLIEVEAACPWIREAAFAICVEPTSNAVELGCLGTLHARVTVHGKAAHSARPWLGKNAVHAALPLLNHIAAVPERRYEVPGRGDLVYREVINVTTIEGGVARNTLPPCVTFNVNFRFAPDRSGKDACRFVGELVGNQGEVEFTDVSGAGAVPRDHPICERLVRIAGITRAKQAWTDVGRFTEWHIPAVSFGPGLPEMAHQKDEYASIESMVKSFELFTRFLTRESSEDTPSEPPGRAP